MLLESQHVGSVLSPAVYSENLLFSNGSVCQTDCLTLVNRGSTLQQSAFVAHSPQDLSSEFVEY